MLTPDGGDSPYDKRKVYQKLHNRLRADATFSAVHYRPSRTRPRKLHADVDPQQFVEQSYSASVARLEIEFLFRPDWTQYWIQWIEPEREFACGWHQDTTHPELGKCHFQIDHTDGSTDRDQARVLDAHPLQVVETRLQQLPEKLRSLNHDQNNRSE